MYVCVFCRIYEATHDRVGKNNKELTINKGEIVEVSTRSKSHTVIGPSTAQSTIKIDKNMTLNVCK